MAIVTIRLFDTGAGASRSAIELSGEQSSPGSDVTLTAVVVTRPGPDVHTYRVVGSIGDQATIRFGYIDDTRGVGDYRLRRGPRASTVTAPLFIPDPALPTPPLGSWPFFGRNFAARGTRSGIDLGLTLNLPGAASALAIEGPLAQLDIRGHVEVAAGATMFSAAPLGYRVEIDRLPAAFPSDGLPDLTFFLPDGIPWPDQGVPWVEFPTLPGPSTTAALRLPAFSADLDPLPVRIGWDKIDVTLDGTGELTADVKNFRLSGSSRTIQGSPRIHFDADAISFAPGLALEGLTSLSVRDLGLGNLGFDATGSVLGNLLGLVSQELGDASGAAEDLKLRLRTTGREIQEVRLDWGIDSTGRALKLPGFSVTFPGVQMLSLVLRRGDPTAPDGDGLRATLVATIDVTVAHPSPEVKAQSTFCWPLEDGRRENLRDGDGAGSDAFVTLTATLRRRTSVVLCDLPVGKSRGTPARYLHRLRSPLATLSSQESGAGHQDTTSFVTGLFDPQPDEPFEVVPLTKEDVTLRLEAPSDFVLPFLNSGGQGISLRISSATLNAATQEFDCILTVTVTIGGQPLSTAVALAFVPRLMAFRVNREVGFWLSAAGDLTASLFDLNWRFKPNPETYLVPGSVTAENRGGLRVDNALFVLTTKDRNYALRLAPGASVQIDYTRATSEGDAIQFLVDEFGIGHKGIDLRARVTDKPAKFNGLETKFKFTEGLLQIHESRVDDFTISGTGPLPPALVDDAVADVTLRFAQGGSGSVRLARGTAQIKGSNLLKCVASRVEVSLDGLGLEFVDDGVADHLYFTISGQAKYTLLPGDNPSGPLAWMPAIKIQLINCPLTGNMRVIAQHVNFTVDLPKKVSFSFLGCFTFELRSIGFLSQFDKILDRGEPTSALQLGGQVMFAEDGGDVLETKVDFHNLYVALPAPGSSVPRLYLKEIGIHIKQGEQFKLDGDVHFFNNEPVDRNANGTPILGDGFSGGGSLQIQGMFPMSATFAFLRVSPDGGATWKRAWFIYLQASQLSVQVPVVEVFLREVGLGFGYRYTLASIKATDEAGNDPKKLLASLKQLSRTQGNLSSRDQWRVDLERPGEGTHWTIAFRGMFSQATAQKGPYGDYDAKKEAEVACLYLLDVVVALRSDLTFFMAGRAWLNTNYQDFLKSQAANSTLPSRPAFSGFVVLSPRQKRFLANLSSNPDAEFGMHPIVPDFLQSAFRNSKFSATLLVEPGLVHYEMGWPNQLQWGGDLGPLQVEFRGGAIFRASTTEVVVGNSFLAQGTLKFEAPFDGGLIGGSVSATARVAFGARYIGVLAFQDPVNNSALYGALGLEIRVRLAIDGWVGVKLRLFKKTRTIKKGFSLGVGVNFTAALEVGILFDPGAVSKGLPAMRGSATIGIRVMGHNIHCDVHVEKDGDNLGRAIGLTQRFLNVGLEAESVEPVPGVNGASPPSPSPPGVGAGAGPSAGVGGGVAAGLALVGSAPGVALAPAPPAGTALTSDAQDVKDQIDLGTRAPDAYNLTTIRAPLFVSGGVVQRRVYFLLVPGPPAAGAPSRFFPVPPDFATFPTPPAPSPIVSDMSWTFPAPDPKVVFEHFDHVRSETDFSPVIAGTSPYAWKVDWGKTYPIEGSDPTGDPLPDGAQSVMLIEILAGAYLYRDKPGPVNEDLELGDPIPPAFEGTGGVGTSADKDDERVRNPSASAYEAAVRGAFEQVAAPYFRFDENSDYDRLLRNACKGQTSIYANGGTTDGLSDPDKAAVLMKRQAIQIRGTILHQMLRDVQRYAELEGRTDAASTKERDDLRAGSLAFRMGMVFRATGKASELSDGDADELLWLHHTTPATSKLQQRLTPASTAPDSGEIRLAPFNRLEHDFSERPPTFSRIRRYEHANSIAFSWELNWSASGSAVTADDPEEYLSHYKVRRFQADGNDPQTDFTVLKGSVLHLDPTNPGTPVPRRLLSRFQIADHFDPSPGGDAEPLTELGKTYVYTIVPVDVAGNESSRPLTLSATRYPSDPPLVPTDGELLIEYALPDDVSAWPATLPTRPTVREDGLTVSLSWTDPPFTPGVEPPPVGSYNLIFRREETLPVGFYGADQYTRGGVTNGFPVTNARPLRTDIILPVPKPGPDRKPYSVLPADLIKNNILPGDGVWRPEAWRVFIQTVSPQRPDGQSAASSLAAVSIRMRFSGKRPAPATSGLTLATTTQAPPVEDRQFGVLEWLPDPIRFDLLPPEDQSGTAGFAQVPMPGVGQTPVPADWLYPIDGDIVSEVLPGLQFELHPERIRALKMTWNQGPSAVSDHPIELHAKYQIYQFDADARPGEAVESRSVKVTPAQVKAGDTFSLTLRGKSVSFTARADGPANVVDGLVGVWVASTEPVIRELVAKADPSRRFLTLTPTRAEARFTVVADARGRDATRHPTLTVTQDLNEWRIDAGLRVVQEVELLPADDLPLNPSDTSNPIAWDVWTPATSRRIGLRHQMIAHAPPIWPATTSRTILGPWYSWRDSYLNWPDPDPQPDDPATYLTLTDSAGSAYPGTVDPLPSPASLLPRPGGASTMLTLSVDGHTKSFDLGEKVTLQVLADAINRADIGAWAEVVPDPRGRGGFVLRRSVLPPVVEPHTRSTWPYHPLFRALLNAIAREQDDGGDQSQPRFLLELGGVPARGDNPVGDDPTVRPVDPAASPPGGGARVNPYPSIVSSDDPTGMAGFLRDNSPEADPHAWGILNRMGLSVSFRVRVRKTGEYFRGADLDGLIRRHLHEVLNTPRFSLLKALAPHLHVEYLFQPGAKNDLAANEDPAWRNPRVPRYDDLLALARLSLRPTITQRVEYGSYSVSEFTRTLLPTPVVERLVPPGGTPVEIIVTATSAGVGFAIWTGAPAEPVDVAAGQTVTLQVVMPPKGALTVLVRGESPLGVTVTGAMKDSDGNVLTAAPAREPFRPIDWPSTFLTIPKEAPWPKETTDPLGPAPAHGETPSPQTGWKRLRTYLLGVQGGLPCLAVEAKWLDPDDAINPLKVPELRAQLLGWLNRFFIEGGDASAPGDDGMIPNGSSLARTGVGPWVTAAYPRTATPVALSPDPAGRITSFQLIEDLWGHTHRYYLRPQGRYDLIWSALSRSKAVFDPVRAFGLIDRLQRETEPPALGGLDVVMDRIRPLEAPMVLSSRRLDPPAPAGRTVPPGATWEVLVARHAEQELIDRNRALVNHLGFRQIAHALVRTFTHGDTIADLQPVVARVVSAAFPPASLVIGARTFHLVAGATSARFTLNPTDGIGELKAAINTHAGAAIADVEEIAPGPFGAARLVFASPVSPLQLFLVDDTDVERDLLNSALDLSLATFEMAINAIRPTVADARLPKLPALPAALDDHINVARLQPDEALSIDLPLRSERFTQGLMALQWQATPYYYAHRLLLVAQAAAVTSTITVVDQRDFEYTSPAYNDAKASDVPSPTAVMEGVDFPDTGSGRRRRIVFSLARLWDCLPPEGRTRWSVEDPVGVGKGDPASRLRRPSSTPDRDVIYQVMVEQLSGNVEVLAEYRFQAGTTAGYQSLKVSGPYRGDAVRLLPPAEGDGVGRHLIGLETLLTRVDGTAEPVATASGPISGRAKFAGPVAAAARVRLETEAIRVCALHLNLTSPLDAAAVNAALQELARTVDVSFQSALRRLAAGFDLDRYAEACIGVEQVVELNAMATVDVTEKLLTWPGEMNPDQKAAVEKWAGISLFSKAFNALLGGTQEEPIPAGDANNPTQADVAPIPTTRLEVLVDRFAWHDVFGTPATAAEIATLTALRAKAELPAAVGLALDALLAALADPSRIKAVVHLDTVEPAWRPRPTQANLPAALKDVLLVGNGLMTVTGMMSRDEGNALLQAASLTEPDRQAIYRLFEGSLNAGLGGGELKLGTRRGSAVATDAKILASIKPTTS